jgi:hypothetical protein
LQPLLLLIAGSRLKIPNDSSSSHVQAEDGSNDVMQLRYFVEARMIVLARKYAQKPLQQMLDILKEVWHRLDDGSGRAHWMDVMHAERWQTILG